MDIEKWLNRGYKLNLEINELLRAQQYALLSATDTVAAPSGEKVQTSRKNTSEQRFINYAEYSKLIDDRIDELYALRKEILETINRVDDSVSRTLLIGRYINFKTWERISEDMHYSREWITKKLYPKAIKEISKIVYKSSL